ncbi:hypothetical protein QTP88_006747 [Uroleucon formosanum]
MFKYYFKRAGNNQTIHISQRTWLILNLDRSIDVDSLTPNECLSYIETVKHSEITEAFSQCRNIKLPSDVKEIAELNFGILFSLELPNKLTKEEFTQKSLEEKIELLSVPKSLYLYYFLSKDDLIQILRFFNKEFSKSSETIELRLSVRSILNRNQSEDDNDSDPDFIPKPFNIDQRSPVITHSKLAHPLTELTKGKFKSKKSIIPWSETQEIAFKNLKLKLTNKPVLSHFNDNVEIILVTDGSKKGLGVILQQINENHEIHPVAYASKKLNTAQNNYSALELEMAALHFGCIHFRQYLHGRTFTVWTDHKNLIQLQTIKSESTILNRLRTKLIGFDFTIIYKKGIFNQAADFLSRYPIENNVLTTNLNEHQINIVEPINLKILQARDSYLKNIITVLENSEIVDIKWQNKAKSYTLNNKNGLIYYKEKINGHPKLVLAIPEILTNEVIQNFHDNKMSGAHLGIHKVYNKIKTRYHWPLMHKQIKAYVTSCIHCQKRKPDKSKQVGKMLTYPIENGIPFSDVTIDYVGPLMPSRDFRYILVATCRVTKYCVAKACRNVDAKSTIVFLLDFLLLSYGAMKVVRSDDGTHFTAKVISDILTALNLKKTEGIAYRPTSQGGVEKQNQVIIDMMKRNNEKWSDVLQIVLHAYNSTIHYSTGYSPFYLLHGYEPSSIFDIAVIPNSLEHSVIEELNKLQKVRNTIPEILKKAFENQKMNTDKNRSDIDFKVGEQVLVKTPIRKHKFSDRYDEPYPIIKKLNTNSYLIKLPKNDEITTREGKLKLNTLLGPKFTILKSGLIKMGQLAGSSYILKFVNILFDSFEVNLLELDSLKSLIIVSGNSESLSNAFGDFKQMGVNSNDFSLSNSKFFGSELTWGIAEFLVDIITLF